MSFSIKRGDTVDLNCAIPSDLGAVISTIEVSANYRGVLVDDLTVTPLGDDGTSYNWTISADSEQTLLWPLSTIDCDLKVTYTNSKISHSDTFKISVARAETV